MDGNRFDNWTRNRALRLSRRNALKIVGASGVAAVAPGMANAQPTCTLALRAQTVGGPSAPAVYDGVFRFSHSTDGPFATASFTPTGGVPLVATGQSVGRAIDFQIDLDAERTLTFSGVSAAPIATCQGDVAGVLTGPRPGDIGAWQASTGTATAPPPANTTSAPPATNTPTAPGNNCPAPQTECGPTCCPTGLVCTDTAQGICSCPGGTTSCGAACVPSCPGGQELDPASCTCVSSCAGLDCGPAGCIDPSTDPANCGSCGNACQTRTCVGGVCVCREDGEPCDASTDCCAGACSSGVCGCAKLGQSCDDATFECCEGTPVICFNATCCILTGFPCSADADCCDYIQARGFCTNGICTRTG